MAAIGHHAGIDKCLTKKHNKKTVGFIKKFFIGLLRVGGLLVDKFVSPTNQLYQVWPALFNINSDEPLYYTYSLSVNKWKS